MQVPVGICKLRGSGQSSCRAVLWLTLEAVNLDLVNIGSCARCHKTLSFSIPPFVTASSSPQLLLLPVYNLLSTQNLIFYLIQFFFKTMMYVL